MKTPTANRMIHRIRYLQKFDKPLIVAGCMAKAERKLLERGKEFSEWLPLERLVIWDIDFCPVLLTACASDFLCDFSPLPCCCLYKISTDCFCVFFFFSPILVIWIYQLFYQLFYCLICLCMYNWVMCALYASATVNTLGSCLEVCMLCQFVYKFLCIKFHSLIHVYGWCPVILFLLITSLVRTRC